MSTDTKFLKALGKNIDRLRKEQGITFQELALRSDLEKSNLIKLASQGTNVTTNTVLKISRGLNIPLSEIFDFPYQ